MARSVKNFEPMLAASKVVTPRDVFTGEDEFLASFKMDGIRAFIAPTTKEHFGDLLLPGENGGWRTPSGNLKTLELLGPFCTMPMTRSLKPIRNTHINHHLSMLPPGLDGEIGLVDPKTNAVDFRKTTSGVMNGKGEPDFRFFVFDFFLHDAPYFERYELLQGMRKEGDLPDWVEIVEQRPVRTPQCIESMYEEALALGHEGLILRPRMGLYKAGRSSPKERLLLKMKPWEDSEGEIVGIEAEQENTNEMERDERGYAKRSSAKDGKVARDRVGVLLLRDEKRWPGVESRVGTGMTHADKEAFFQNPPIGQLAKYRFITVGGYDAPRHASFLGIRHPDDMS